jgi:hypothetical protein
MTKWRHNVQRPVVNDRRPVAISGIRDWDGDGEHALIGVTGPFSSPYRAPQVGTNLPTFCVTITGTTDLRQWRPKYPVARYLVPSLPFSFLCRPVSQSVCVAEGGFGAWGSMRTRMWRPAGCRRRKARICVPGNPLKDRGADNERFWPRCRWRLGPARRS